MPIKGLSEQKRLPRLGKIRLGVKKKSNKTGQEYPSATDYFVCPPEVQEVYGEQPTELEIIIPVEDEELWANQYYRQYSRTRGLVCKGDGETCRRMVDTDTGATANRETKEVTWKVGLPCTGRDCPEYQSKNCQEVMNLQFMLPKVAGLGIWQIDTGSINSIRNVNNMAAMIRAACDRISWIPLVLTLEPTEVTNPDDGKKKTVRCLNIRHKGSLGALLQESDRPKNSLLVEAPNDSDTPDDIPAPEDEPRLNKADIVKAKDAEPAGETTEIPIDELYGDGTISGEEPKSTEQKKPKPDKKPAENDKAGPTDLPSFMSWLQSHDKKCTPSWFYKNFSDYSPENMKESKEEIARAYKDVLQLTNWDN